MSKRLIPKGQSYNDILLQERDISIVLLKKITYIATLTLYMLEWFEEILMALKTVVQKRHHSSVLAIELRLFCIQPSISITVFSSCDWAGLSLNTAYS